MDKESNRGGDILKTHEKIDPHTIAIVTATSFPGWKKGNTDLSVEQVRGDAVLDMAKAAKEKGYQMLVVEGSGKFASTIDFRDELTTLGVTVLEQSEDNHGMAGSRRQVIEAGSKLPNVKVVIWSEEKPSLLEDNSPDILAGPILRNEADIVIYNRGEDGLSSYNPEQAKWERRANKTFNSILVAQGLKPEDSPVLDVWSGPRAIKNDPEIIDLFMHQYEFQKITDENRPNAIKYHKRINPERWSNSIFLPVIDALHKGYRVSGRNVNYRHRESMNKSEQENPEMIDKRETQFVDIIHNSIHFINYLKGKPSRITKVK